MLGRKIGIRVLGLGMGLGIGLLAAGAPAQAQTFPNRDIAFVAPSRQAAALTFWSVTSQKRCVR